MVQLRPRLPERYRTTTTWNLDCRRWPRHLLTYTGHKRNHVGVMIPFSLARVSQGCRPGECRYLEDKGKQTC
eukprot:5765936-Amphidinium_carterae.1